MTTITDHIDKLRGEVSERSTMITRLVKLQEVYPDIRRHEGRWRKETFCSKGVNTQVTGYDRRYNCGCCSDSPLEIWPYVETEEYGKVYSDPPCFQVGEKDWDYGAPHPYDGWEKSFREAQIPDAIVEKVRSIFGENAEDDDDL